MKLIIFSSIFVLLNVNFAYSLLCNTTITDIIRPDASQIKYYLYTTNSSYTQVYPGNLNNVTINVGCNFVFITHGFTENGFVQWILDMKDQLFRTTSCINVVIIDWSAICAVFNYYDVFNIVYPFTAYKTCYSGYIVGDFLIEIYKTLGVSPTNMHLIGHSLGAHLCGCAGQFFTKQTGLLVARISGMDAAGPCFDTETSDCKLSRDDATFVDCIHTDTSKFGHKKALGHVDFYPNGGAQQPGCPSTKYGDLALSCNHCFAYVLYNTSITKYGFISNVCDSYINYEYGMCTTTKVSEMGYYADKTVTGELYLDCLPDPDYAMNGERRNTLVIG